LDTVDATARDRAAYYDDWRNALREASDRINQTHQQHIAAAEQRVDTAYQQDKAGVQQRDAEASEQAAKLGRAPVTSQEGHQAVEAARSQGNQAIAGLRSRAASDTKYMELRGVNAAQAKIEDQRRLAGRREAIMKERRGVERERGAFKVD